MYSSVFLVVATLSTKYTFTHLQILKKDRHLYNKNVRTRNSTSLMTIAFLVEVEYSERARHRGRSTPCDRWRRCILKPRSTGATRSRIQVYISVMYDRARDATSRRVPSFATPCYLLSFPIHGVCILYGFEYLTFRINGMVRYLSVSIEQNYIRTETLAVLPTGNLIFQLWACVIPIYIHFLLHTFASTTYSWDCLLHARGAADFFSRGHVG